MKSLFELEIESKKLKGLDSLLSIAQMPAGVPVGTLAVGEAGAKIIVTSRTDKFDGLKSLKDLRKVVTFSPPGLAPVLHTVRIVHDN